MQAGKQARKVFPRIERIVLQYRVVCGIVLVNGGLLNWRPTKKEAAVAKSVGPQMLSTNF